MERKQLQTPEDAFVTASVIVLKWYKRTRVNYKGFVDRKQQQVV